MGLTGQPNEEKKNQIFGVTFLKTQNLLNICEGTHILKPSHNLKSHTDGSNSLEKRTYP